MIWSVDASTERSIILASHPESRSNSSANRFLGSHLGTHFAVSLCLLAALGGGCIFSPHKDDDPPTPKPPRVYPVRNTPKNAVLYLTYAWEDRDSVRIDSVYADDYEGTSIDLVDPANPSFIFHKSDEVRTVGAMALTQNIQTIDVDFALPAGWIEGNYASDPPEWRYVQIPSPNIYIHDIVEGEYRARPQGGETWIFEFTLRPTYPNGTAEEAVWEIVKWVESRSTN